MASFFEKILIQPLFNLLILLTVWIPGHSLGWAIIAVTVLIRVALMSSAAHSIRQQHKMQRIQPRLKEIQDKHKDDRETLAKEMMNLYKEEDIHPLGSCLPMLIQLPILIALFYVFQKGLDVSNLHLLYSFVPHPETVNTLFLGVDLSKPAIAFAILAGILQYLQSSMLLKDPHAHKVDNPTQKMLNLQLMYFMPLVTVFISLSLPAALPLYWIVTTLFAIAQQRFILGHIKPATVVTQPVTQNTLATDIPMEKTENRGGVSITVRNKGSQ